MVSKAYSLTPLPETATLMADNTSILVWMFIEIVSIVQRQNLSEKPALTVLSTLPVWQSQENSSSKKLYVSILLIDFQFAD